ncbi:MAG: polysaccharide biosynthesis tyrosine autokinase [Dysgonamonadaceae bacterium]|jgi:capsular exopolysaccharide synthesis family protein|nr:polysaccharide biosynthesis tyrosine autokinase [Dysgonamonadaceae bacterium]
MESIQNQTDIELQEEISVIEILFRYLQHWKFFIISLVVCVAIAGLYLHYTTSEYKVSAKVLLTNSKNAQRKMEYNAFEDLGIFVPNNTFDNEVELVKSKSLLLKVVDSLKIGVSYFKEGKIKNQEIYNNTPLFVKVENQLKDGSFTLNRVDSTYSIRSNGEDFHQNFQIGEEVRSPWGLLTFEKNPFGTEDSFPIEVVINRPDYAPNVQITPVSNTTSVVEISMVTTIPKKGEEIINTLIDTYNKQTIDDKNFVANNTIRFIDERLLDISGELDTAERNVENYARIQGITDIATEANLFLSSSSDYEKRIADVSTQVNILNSIKSFLTNPNNAGNVAPANVGLTDNTVLSLVQKYNEEILAKNKNTIGMTDRNAAVKEYDRNITMLKDNLLKGINISETGLETMLTGLRKQENTYISKARGLSTQARESNELYRQKNIKENLFIYLMQKREETGLSLALATPNLTVIDPPKYGLLKVAPKSNIILLAAILLGLLIPILFIYAKDLLDNKLRNKEQLQRIIKAPFLGDIPVNKLQKVFPVLNLSSGIAEKIRIIISNLQFIVSGEKAKVIMVTSSHSGEGKSFFSQNLAMSMATLKRKTLLVDIDMRKSELKKTLDMNPTKGLAMYLSDPSIELRDIIYKMSAYNEYLDIIPVHVFPPNPAELLLSDRLEILFEVLKERYDYIIVDTAPVGLTADAFQINRFVDATIYVTRAGYTWKSTLPEIESLYRQHKLHNLTVVLNAAPNKNSYGYGYGYGYGKNKHNYYTEDKK